MDLFRLVLCMAVDGTLTALSGGVWIAMANTCMDGTLTQKEIRHQHEKEKFREFRNAITFMRSKHGNE